MHILLPKLSERYGLMATKLSNNDSKVRIVKMLEVLTKNQSKWNHYKIGVWIGCIQTLIIVENITTFEAERDFTRKLHHDFFKRNGYEIPETINVME